MFATIAIRAMGAARPTIVTDNVENSEFPVGACLKVAHGPGEATGLFEAMSLICEFPDVASRIGATARRHVLNEHAPDRVARMYLDALRSAAWPANPTL